MYSFSEGECLVLDFLIRHPLQRLTVRSLAKELGLSPAGLHLAFKKLEKQQFVFSEKLGSGLFYSFNFSHPQAHYLACFLMSSSQSIVEDGEDIILISKDKSLRITDGPVIDDEYETITEEEFKQRVRNQDKKLLTLMEKGYVKRGASQFLSLLQHTRGMYP